MSTFWMYLWYSQAMLIWYGNLAEEAIYFTRRLVPPFGALMAVNVALNLAVPFVVLLSRRAKRNPKVLDRVCLTLLLGHGLDLYLMIAPALAARGSASLSGFTAAGAALGLSGLLPWLTLRAFAAAPPVPTGDPSLEASRRHHA